MNPTLLDDLANKWIEWKEKEKYAVEARRELEDEMRRYANLTGDVDGTETILGATVKVKIVGRIDRKVDSDKLIELAAEHGLNEHLSSLFRWKPEINMSAWKMADSSITRPLADAITAKPGRPSFSVEIIKEEK